MSCNNGAIDCFPPRCKKDQLVCFNQCLTVLEQCSTPDDAAIKDDKISIKQIIEGSVYFLNPFLIRQGPRFPTLILNGTVVLTNDSTSNCTLRYAVVDANGLEIFDVPPGTSTAIVVKNLLAIDVVPNEESSPGVATGEIVLQLFYIVKLSCCS